VQRCQPGRSREFWHLLKFAPAFLSREPWAFHLTFHVVGRARPAESLARTLTVRPESATLIYVGDSFRVRETLFVPVQEPGTVILIEVETAEPLQLEASLVGDFALEWPAAIDRLRRV
jgi:hypothetical protein